MAEQNASTREEYFDIFDKLFPTKWRSVEFPSTSVTLSFEHDLVEHRYYRRSGANVEATGRGPLVFEVSIPFFDGLEPGATENWPKPLYPETFLDFLDAFLDGSTGEFQHPELGPIACKPSTYRTSHDAERRNGVFVTASWKETVDLSKGGRDIFTFGNHPAGVGQNAAKTLDANKASMKALIPNEPVYEETWEEMFNKLQGKIDTGIKNAQLATAKPGQLLSRVNRLKGSLMRAGDPQTWPLIDACDSLVLAAKDIGKAVTYRKTLRYTVSADSSLPQLASILGASVADLLHLNPEFISDLEVPAGATIRYYASLLESRAPSSPF